jgi:hypothetical protein
LHEASASLIGNHFDPEAAIYYDRNFLPMEDATKLFEVLKGKMGWGGANLIQVCVPSAQT